MVERRPLTATADKPTAAAVNGSGPLRSPRSRPRSRRVWPLANCRWPQKFEWFDKKLKAALSDSSVTASELGNFLPSANRHRGGAAGSTRGPRAWPRFRRQPRRQAAREAIENAEFAISRFLTQRPRLEALLQARLLAEARDKYLVRYEQLKMEGAALGAELADLPIPTPSAGWSRCSSARPSFSSSAAPCT